MHTASQEKAMEILRGIRNRFQEHRLELLAGRRTAIIALSSIPLHQHTASQKQAAEIPRGIRNRFREQPLVALQAATLLWSILLRLHTALPAQAVETLPGILNCFREHPLELLRNEMWRGMGARLFFTKNRTRLMLIYSLDPCTSTAVKQEMFSL